MQELTQGPGNIFGHLQKKVYEDPT